MIWELCIEFGFYLGLVVSESIANFEKDNLKTKNKNHFLGMGLF